MGTRSIELQLSSMKLGASPSHHAGNNRSSVALSVSSLSSAEGNDSSPQPVHPFGGTKPIPVNNKHSINNVDDEDCSSLGSSMKYSPPSPAVLGTTAARNMIPMVPGTQGISRNLTYPSPIGSRSSALNYNNNVSNTHKNNSPSTRSTSSTSRSQEVGSNPFSHNLNFLRDDKVLDSITDNSSLHDRTTAQRNSYIDNNNNTDRKPPESSSFSSDKIDSELLAGNLKGNRNGHPDLSATSYSPLKSYTTSSKPSEQISPGLPKASGFPYSGAGLDLEDKSPGGSRFISPGRNRSKSFGTPAHSSNLFSSTGGGSFTESPWEMLDDSNQNFVQPLKRSNFENPSISSVANAKNTSIELYNSNHTKNSIGVGSSNSDILSVVAATASNKLDPLSQQGARNLSVGVSPRVTSNSLNYLSDPRILSSDLSNGSDLAFRGANNSRDNSSSVNNRLPLNSHLKSSSSALKENYLTPNSQVNFYNEELPPHLPLNKEWGVTRAASSSSSQQGVGSNSVNNNNLFYFRDAPQQDNRGNTGNLSSHGNGSNHLRYGDVDNRDRLENTRGYNVSSPMPQPHRSEFANHQYDYKSPRVQHQQNLPYHQVQQHQQLSSQYHPRHQPRPVNQLPEYLTSPSFEENVHVNNRRIVNQHPQQYVDDRQAQHLQQINQQHSMSHMHGLRQTLESSSSIGKMSHGGERLLYPSDTYLPNSGEYSTGGGNYNPGRPNVGSRGVSIDNLSHHSSHHQKSVSGHPSGIPGGRSMQTMSPHQMSYHILPQRNAHPDYNMARDAEVIPMSNSNNPDTYNMMGGDPRMLAHRPSVPSYAHHPLMPHERQYNDGSTNSKMATSSIHYSHSARHQKSASFGSISYSDELESTSMINRSHATPPHQYMNLVPPAVGVRSSQGSVSSSSGEHMTGIPAPFPSRDVGQLSTTSSQMSSIPVPNVVYNVKFKRTQRSFIPGPRAPRDIKIGCYVKVEADRGEDLGFLVSRVPAGKYNSGGRPSYRMSSPGPSNEPGACMSIPSSGGGSIADLKQIIRLATHDEVNHLKVKHQEEDELLKICSTKVKQRNLPMNVVDAEYQFDRNKLTFFFEAEGRIDFRELVRDLFSIYKTRIWMQQLDKNGAGVGSATPGGGVVVNENCTGSTTIPPSQHSVSGENSVSSGVMNTAVSQVAVTTTTAVGGVPPVGEHPTNLG
eukprot:CAMPEP_0178957586 /NCGR_PEP_ID=MMETSP0789-20121207/11015_1 /TAXON_ID=3005 /ORGANISM="Rhizosolenia setigera, Strain CCMP 1694" /LENGTH=1183 /DNA_ID=CAMNT_0020639889 /DNA_START=349 /DNA_END=3901 /DNA_ORIENTATION=+